MIIYFKYTEVEQLVDWVSHGTDSIVIADTLFERTEGGGMAMRTDLDGP